MPDHVWQPRGETTPANYLGQTMTASGLRYDQCKPIGRVGTKEGESDTSYQQWYQHAELGAGDFAMESQLWEDAIMSMEYGALYCRSVVACTDRNSMEKVLFELIRLAADRPDLEGVCFSVSVLATYANRPGPSIRRLLK